LAGGSAHADPTTSFNGIAALPGCSGALFRFDGQSMDDKALILTNGHCIGSMGSYEVVVGEAYETEVTIFDSSDRESSTYWSTEITYGTMHDTDMAILRLDVTYQDIKDVDDADSLWLRDGRADIGEAIAITSGYWEYITTCELDGFVYAMQEGEWDWTDSLRFTQECVTYGGTSGSPVISIDDGDIVGVNNTAYEGGEPCTTNNPCEIDETGAVTTIPDGSYGQQTYHLYSCIDDDFEIDLSQPGCALPIPRGVLDLSDVEIFPEDECDADGNLDAGETATLTIHIDNDGPVALNNTRLTISSSSASLSFPDGADIPVDPMGPWESTTVNIVIAVDEDVADLELATLDIVVTDPESAVPEVATVDVHRLNYDILPESSASDDIESGGSAWSVFADVYYGESDGWSLLLDDDANTLWHGDDVDFYGDLQLESPTLEVGEDDFVVSFSHRYKFEESRGTYWDGGVIEVSTDGGDTWDDASDYADVDYGGEITNESGNVLGYRDAFVDESAAWPDMSSATLDFGTQLAGESVLLRFRIGTDAAAGDYGWDIDDIDIAGLTNLPFSSLQDHDDLCGAESPTDPADDGSEEESTLSAQGGCGCDANTSGGAGWFVILAVLGLARRRR